MSERSFDKCLQHLVTRDESLLHEVATFGPLRPITAVIGFDGFSDCCHVYLRLIDYKADVCKESELKGTGLAIASGDDHNANLSRLFVNFTPAINKYIETGATVTIGGRDIPVDIATCLDYSAARSMPGLRSNGAPHSVKLTISQIIEAPKGSTWAQIKALLVRKLPWRTFDEKKPLNHVAPQFPWGCSRCAYKVESAEEQQDNMQAAAALNAIVSPAGKVATAKRVKTHCEAHDDVMEFQSRVINIASWNNIVDLLHAMDINIPTRLFKFCFHDKVLLDGNKSVSPALKAYYDYIGCPFDPSGDKGWWHGAVWHYEIVLAAQRSSPGLDIFILSCCLICYGVTVADTQAQSTTVEDDMSDSEDEPAPEAEDDALGTILRRLFGHNAAFVRSIFTSFVCYGNLFNATNDAWTSNTTEYKEERATETYWTGLAQLKAVRIMSNERCDSDYFALIAYIACQQMAIRGDLWPYSTRAVEGRGGRYKRIDRRIICKRKRASKVMRAVRNVKLGVVSFKESAYNSTRTLQMLRASTSQEVSAHSLHGRSRISTTGRKTLNRSMPKWKQAEIPVLGRLLDPVALEEMLVIAALQFQDAVHFSTEACMEPCDTT